MIFLSYDCLNSTNIAYTEARSATQTRILYVELAVASEVSVELGFSWPIVSFDQMMKT